MTSGFYVYDLFILVKAQKTMYYELSSTLMGVNESIHYSESSRRLSLIKDYNSIMIIPSLHLSRINFVGMHKKDFYLVWKEEKDLFIAASKVSMTIW
jgi:hypothetical protein